MGKVWVFLAAGSCLLSCSGHRRGIGVVEGAVVVTAAPGQGAQLAGLQPGDHLRRWRRGASELPVQSPFDLVAVEIAETPLGPVSLEGQRGSERRRWSLDERGWGLELRPALTGAALADYQEARRERQDGHVAAAATRLRGLARALAPSPAARWLALEAAQWLSGAQQWEAADAAFAESGAGAEGPALIQVEHAWARSLMRRSKWPEADRHFEGALAEARRRGPRSLTIAFLQDGQALAASESGRYDVAEAIYRQALALREGVAPNTLAVATSHYYLSVIAERRDDLEAAERHLRVSYAIIERVAPDGLRAAFTLKHMANVADDRGDLDRAHTLYMRALAIEEKLIPGSKDLADSLDNLGLNAHSRGDLATAEAFQIRALAIYEQKAPGSLDQAMALHNAGMVAESRGDRQRAEQLYRRALAQKEKIAPGGLIAGTTLVALGNMAWNRNDLATARDYYQRALELQKKWGRMESGRGATILSDLGGVARKAGDRARAEEYYRRAIAIRDQIAPGGIDVAGDLYQLGKLAFERGDTRTAEASMRRALVVAEKNAPGSLDHALALWGMAAIERKRGAMAAAGRFLARAVDAFEEQVSRLGGTYDQRSTFRAVNADLYQDYIDLLLAQQKPELAFEVAERARARSLLEMLAQSHVDLRRGVEPALLQRERALRANLAAKSARRLWLVGEEGAAAEAALAAVKDEIARTLDDYREVESQIRASSPGHAELTQPQALTAREVRRQLLDPGTLLLVYQLGPERSHLFALGDRTLATFALPGRAVIEAAAQKVHDGLAKRAPPSAEGGEQHRQAVAALSRMVLGPVQGLLGDRRLYIVADGALQYVPFGVLLDGQSRLLVEGHELAKLPSASVLAALRRQSARRPARGGAVAVLADPVFAASDSRVTAGRDALAVRADHARPRPSASLLRDTLSGLQRLPFTRQEAEAIAAVTSGPVLKALDFQASRATVLGGALADHRIVHFATHGLLDNTHPELSGLVLSLVDERGRPQDGFLDLQDIYNLDLPADLVVLSGCETGLGKAISGEGLVGVTRGFMYAGASRVVATLWKVDDLSTGDLMGRFYRAMQREGRPPAAALRQAQREMMAQQDFAAPYHWAAFELHGQW